MSPRRLLSALCAIVLLAGSASALFASPAQAAGDHTVLPLHFTVHVGPDGTDSCSVVGDLYLPDDASSTHRVPAILTTNGFGGSKDDQAGMAATYADRGYAVLSYSGLGFGGSACNIELDNPDYDGKAAQQLIDYLAGQTGIAFTDDARTVPAPALDVIALDAPGDPRVGMVGGSYGGAIQFATAAIDQRVDAIIPMITWNDLRYSLSPNNLVPSATQVETPGAAKLFWALGFSLIGVTGGLQNAPADPGRLLGCPSFPTFVCSSLLLAGTTGFIDDAGAAQLLHRSPADYGGTITAPTLIIQGESDTLFNLNEAVRNYRMLSGQGTEVKMIWGNGGHSGPWAPGELDLAADPDQTYTGGRVAAWFDHYLKDLPVDTGPEFAYFRDWIDYTGNAEPAFATSGTVDVAQPSRLYLSGTGLTPDAADIAAGTASFVTPPLGLPTSTDPADVIGDLTGDFLPIPEIDLPGTFASYTTSPLAADLDVVGAPTLDVTVSAPTATGLLGPIGQLVLFVKVSEVAPDGTATIVRNLVAPVRVPDASAPFTVRLPAIVHRFDAGHRLRLTIAGGSTNYRGGVTPAPVTITTGADTQVLTLPTLQTLAVDDPVLPDDSDSGSDQADDSSSADDSSTDDSSADDSPIVDSSDNASADGDGADPTSPDTAAATDDALPGAGSPASLGVLLLGIGLVAAGCTIFSRRLVV